MLKQRKQIQKDYGFHMRNGNYTGGIGEMQSVIVDMLYTYTLAEPMADEHFLLTNTFENERYAIAMARPRNIIDFDFTGLLAGIDGTTFALLAVCHPILTVIISANEKLYSMFERIRFANRKRKYCQNFSLRCKLQIM
jgi:hypothetical protein